MKSYNEMEQPYHREANGIFDGNIIIEEKVDGSQFRIMIDENGIITCASKNMQLGVDSMFKRGTDSAQKVFKGLKANEGDVITIFAEYLPKPKQGRISYERTPKDLFVVFDVHMGGIWLRRQQKEEFCFMWNVECIPLLMAVKLAPNTDKEEFERLIIKDLLNTKSYLGHQPGFDKVEGVVVKNYDKLYDVREGHSCYGHFMCIKYVNEDFKEKRHIKTPKAGNNLEALISSCTSEARWHKALQHCEERGDIKGTMADLGKLVPEAQKDLAEEEKETIKEELWTLFSKDILKGATSGMVIWYKKKLSESSSSTD